MLCLNRFKLVNNLQNNLNQVKMREKKADSEDIPIEEIQSSAKQFMFMVASCYLKIAEEMSQNFFYVATVIQTLQILWYSFHPKLDFLGSPVLLNYVRTVLSYLNFDEFVRTNSTLLAPFIIISCVVIVANVVTIVVSVVCLYYKVESELANIVHKMATIQFLLVNTVFTIPLITISAITLYCDSNSQYHSGRQCYNVQHLVYCVMAGVIAIVLLLESLLFWFIFYIKNPFSRCFLANPNNLWRLGRLLVKGFSPIYFVVDISGTLINVYIFAAAVLIGGYLFFFRLFSLHNYNKHFFYFTLGLEVVAGWYALNNIISYYLNIKTVDGLSLVESTYVCVLFVYLVYSVEKFSSEKAFVENLKNPKIKKQNIQKFIYQLIDMLYCYSSVTKNKLLVIIKLMNSKADTCNFRVSQLFRNRELKPEEQLQIVKIFLIDLINALIQQNSNLIIVKVIRCHLLFDTGHKLLAVHEIVELRNEKLSLAEEFLIYQFQLNYNFFDDNSRRQSLEENSLVSLYHQFDAKMNRFQVLIHQCTANNHEYWEELGEDNPSLIKLRDLASCYSSIMEEIKSVFFDISMIFPNNIRSIRCYKEFLLYVGIDSKQLMRVSESIEAEGGQLVDENNRAQQGLIKFRQNDNLSVISVDTTENAFGVIIGCNTEVKRFLGYSKKELIGSKVAKLMPKIFAETHDTYIRGYLGKLDTQLHSYEKLVFAVNKSGFLVQTVLYVRVMPHEVKGVQLVTFMREVKRSDLNFAMAFIAMETNSIEGVNQGFVNFVNRPFDFSNITKDPLSLSSLLPGFQFNSSMQPGDTFETELKFDTSSDRMLDIEDGSQQPSRDVVIEIISLKYYNGVPMAFFQIKQASNRSGQQKQKNLSREHFPQTQTKMEVLSSFNSQGAKVHPRNNLLSAQFLEQLPIQRKMEDFINSNSKKSEFILIKLLIVLFSFVTILSALFMLAVNKKFEAEVMDLFEATNLSMTIVAQQGRINSLATSLVQTQQLHSAQQIQNLKNSLKLIGNDVKRDMVILIKKANLYEYPLEINENNFYEYRILEASNVTSMLVSSQSYLDGMFQYLANAIRLAIQNQENESRPMDEVTQDFNFLRYNGRQLLPGIGMVTANKIKSLFQSVIVQQIEIEWKLMFGLGLLVLVTFVVLAIILAQLNSFNQFSISIYNSILLWDVNELAHMCRSFSKVNLQDEGVNTINSIKTTIRNNKESTLLNVLPKQLFLDIIEDSSLLMNALKGQAHVEDQYQQNSLLQDHKDQIKLHIPKKSKAKRISGGKSRNVDYVNIEQTYNLKKTIFLIVLITTVVLGVLGGFYFWFQTCQASLQNRQSDIQDLGKIHKNINFINYYAESILVGKKDILLYRDLLNKEISQLHINAAAFYKVIGDPNPILKNVYSQVEAIKSIIIPDSASGQTVPPNDPKFVKIKESLIEDAGKLAHLTESVFKQQQNQLLNEINQMYVIRIIANVIISAILLVFFDSCYLSPMKQSVQESINMIKMLPIWLVKKNKEIKQFMDL